MFFSSRLLPARELLALHNLRWLAMTRFFGTLFFFSSTIVLFQAQRGLNYTEMFLMESIISGAVWLADVPTGLWADRFGYRRLIIAGHGLNLIGLIIFVMAHGFWLFAFSNLLAGLGIACLAGCESALVYRSLPAQKREAWSARAFGLLGASTSAGFFLGLTTGSFLGAISPTLAVVVSIVPSALTVLAALRLRPAPPVEMQETEEGQTGERRLTDLLRLAWRTIREQPSLVGLSAFTNAAFALVNAIFWYNQLYLARAGFPIFWFGPLTALGLGLQAPLALRIGSVQRRLGSRLTLCLSCLLPGLAFLGLAFIRQPWVVLLLLTVIISFPAWREPLISAELNRRIGDESRATVLSALSFLTAVVGIGLNPLIGWVGDRSLETAGVSLGSGLLVLCLCVPLLVSGRRSKARTTAQIERRPASRA